MHQEWYTALGCLVLVTNHQGDKAVRVTRRLVSLFFWYWISLVIALVDRKAPVTSADRFSVHQLIIRGGLLSTRKLSLSIH